MVERARPPRRCFWACRVTRHRTELVASWCVCLVAQASKSPWERLEPAQRFKLFGALILLTIGGISFVILAWLALRVGRRSSRREDVKWEQRRGRVSSDDWAKKPLVKPEDEDQENID